MVGRIGLVTLLVVASALAAASPASALPPPPGYSSSYVGESAFTAIGQGDGQFSAVFFNDGTTSWQPGVVGLLVCASNKVTCNVPWNGQYAKGWYSPTVYASVSTPVSPGQNGFFIYSFTVPAGTTVGTLMTFNGEVGLIATGAVFHPVGYYQINTVPLTVTVAPSTVSLPVGGFQRFTATGVGPSVAWSVSGGCGTITTDGLFIATAMNSKQQPCAVTASSGGRTGSAPITIYGTVTQLACTAASTQLVADGGSASAGTTTVTVSLLDSNGNLVANAALPQVNITNITPILATVSPVGLVTPSAGVALITVTTSIVPGTIQLTATPTAFGLGGCNALITSTGAGVATKTSATFLTNPIVADGVSSSTLQMDVTDAKGVRVTSDNFTQLTATPSVGTCTIVGFTQGLGVMLQSGQASGTVIQGRLGLVVRSTTTPGQCVVSVTTNNISIAGTTAVLGTGGATVATRLAIVSSDAPKPAAQFAACNITGTNTDPSCTTVVVSVVDSNGVILTGDTGRSITATLDTGTCAGAGGGDVQLRQTTTTSGGKATFLFSSAGAYSGCAITFASTSLAGVNTTASWFAGSANHLGCVFMPSSVSIGAMPVAVVSVRDVLGNVVPAGTYSVLFSRTLGSSTTLVTSGQQFTTAGYAYFTVRASAGIGVDTYTPSLSTAVLPGANTTCTITVN